MATEERWGAWLVAAASIRWRHFAGGVWRENAATASKPTIPAAVRLGPNQFRNNTTHDSSFLIGLVWDLWR
jgi:hypothetical protein